MDVFEREGAAVAYRCQGAGPAILFLHNGGASSAIWRNQVASLRATYTVITVDLPGFGSSPRPPGGLDLAGHVDLLAALVEQLGVSRLLVVGNCMGSNIATRLAAAHPDLVAGLVLVNPLTRATFSGGCLGLLHVMERVAPGPARALRYLARRVVLPRPTAVLALRFQIGRSGAAIGLHHDDELLSAWSRAQQLPALIDVLDDMEAYAALDREPVNRGTRTCTVWGAQNRVLSAKEGIRLNGRMRPARAVVLEGCGHLPMLEDPDSVTAIISEVGREAFAGLATAGGRDR